MEKNNNKLTQIYSEQELQDIRQKFSEFKLDPSLSVEEQNLVITNVLKELAKLKYYFVFLETDEKTKDGDKLIEPIFYVSDKDKDGNSSRAIPLFLDSELPQKHIDENQGENVKVDIVEFYSIICNLGSSNLNNVNGILIDPNNTKLLLNFELVRVLAKTFLENSEQKDNK